jgi:hypothetical protein
MSDDGLVLGLGFYHVHYRTKGYATACRIERLTRHAVHFRTEEGTLRSADRLGFAARLVAAWENEHAEAAES